LTVRENLLLAMDNEDAKLCKSFWRGIWNKPSFAKAMEDKVKEVLQMIKMENKVDWLTRDLSFGQKRLVEIARAVLNPHKLLVLDEPVGGVAPQLRDEIAELLVKLNKQGDTILLIEHDMNFTFKISDKIIVLDQGRVIAEGSSEEIRNNPQVLEAYLGE
jgi:branched-chain amino acid transport system ATP-binding protein